jgi:ribosomal protein L37E
MIKAKENAMRELTNTRCSKCGKNAFDVEEQDDWDMSFIFCMSCGTVLAYRDHFLIEKLDKIIEAIPELKLP